MSVETLLPAQPTLPRVNLLPPEVFEHQRNQRLKLVMGATLVAAVGVVAAGTAWAHAGVSAAQSQLTAAQTQHVVLEHQLSALQNVRDTYALVSARQSMLSSAMAGEIQWSHFLTDLSLRIPDNVWLTNLAATTTPSSAGSTAARSTTAALVPTGIGSIQFQGVALTHDDVANWLDALAGEKGFTNPYFTNSTEATIGGQKVVNFSSTVTLTPDALSGRFTHRTGG